MLQKPSRSSKIFRDDELTYFVDEPDIMHLTESERESAQEDFYWDEEQTLFSDLVMEGACVVTCLTVCGVHDAHQISEGISIRGLDRPSRVPRGSIREE